MVLCGLTGAALLASRVAFAQPGDLTEVSPDHDAYAYDRPLAEPPADKAVGVVLSLGSVMLNLVYHPVKLAVGIVGAELGGIAGAVTGGDQEAAAGIWNVTTDGDYWVQPARLDSRRSFSVTGDQRY